MSGILILDTLFGKDSPYGGHTNPNWDRKEGLVRMSSIKTPEEPKNPRWQCAKHKWFGLVSRHMKCAQCLVGTTFSCDQCHSVCKIHSPVGVYSAVIGNTTALNHNLVDLILDYVVMMDPLVDLHYTNSNSIRDAQELRPIREFDHKLGIRYFCNGTCYLAFHTSFCFCRCC